jgi:uncharacterized protein with PhoU and TrkA domain
MVIQDAEETVERVVIGVNSKLAGKSIKQAELADQTGWWILVIRRGNRWIRPKPSTIMFPGDVIIASGYSEGEDDFKQLVKG